MPVLALLHVLLVGPLSRLGPTGQLVVAIGYPVLLTAVVVVLSLTVHRGLLAARARWLFDLPGGTVATSRAAPAPVTAPSVPTLQEQLDGHH